MVWCEYDGGYVKVSGARSIDHRHICAKEGTHGLPANQVLEGLSSFNTAMCYISPALCHDTFVQRVISSATVDMPAPKKPIPIPSQQIHTTMTIMKPTDATLTGQCHHPVTPAPLAQKFGIGLPTATDTIQVATQLGVRSAFRHLSLRYRTDFMSTRHRRLNCTMFTDTLFSKTE